MQGGRGPIFPLHGGVGSTLVQPINLANGCSIFGPRLRVVELEAGRICIDGDLDACMVM